MARTELMTHLRLRDRKHFSDHYLIPALEADMIEMTIPDRPRSSQQRYRLTATGQYWLRMHGKKG